MTFAPLTMHRVSHGKPRRPQTWHAAAAALVFGLLTSSVVVSGDGAQAEASSRAVTAVTASAELMTPVQTTTPGSLGVVSSGYGLSPLSSTAQGSAEQRLDARFIRMPVGFRNGRVTSSASGGSTTLDVAGLVAKYKSYGYQVLVVIGGRTNDIDVQPGDATKIIQALGFDGVSYSSANEPGNRGQSISAAAASAIKIWDEGSALNPSFRIWGPAWAYYNRDQFKQFALALGAGRLAGIDYHHYGMGSSSLSTANAMSQTSSFETEIKQIKADLASLGMGNLGVNVDELNFSWRYRDGTAGGNNRFFSAIDTVWMASSLGHILVAGGKGLPYATQNGALGLTVQPGQLNPDGRADSSPMPAYWGVASLTGAHIFPHFKDTLYQTTSSDASTEVFALNNEAAGYNVLAINKSEADTKLINLATRAVSGGTYQVFTTDPGRPYDAPAVTSSGTYSANDTLRLSLPPMTVSTVVLTPGAAGGGAAGASGAASVPVNLTATRSTVSSVALSWGPPVLTGSSPITGYRISRDGGATADGGYSIVKAAVSRGFRMTLLNPSSYTFTVTAVNGSGDGAPATVVR